MILVTGGLGFLGSHIALSLMSEGIDVVLVDNLSNSNLNTLKRLEFLTQKYVTFAKVDIRNTPALIKVLEDFPITTVIHTAGFKSISESVLRPLDYYNANISGIMSLLRAMQQTGLRNLIYCSSLQVYGVSSLHLTEETSFNFQCDNPYIQSQQFVERIIYDTYRIDDEWKIVILRIANVSGAFDHSIMGEVIPHLPKNIIPLCLQVAAGIREYIELRCQFETVDRTAERNFVHILDVCAALRKSLNLINENSHILEVFNIGGFNVSIAELFKVIENVTGKSISILNEEYSQFEELAKVGTESLKAKQILSWQAKRNIQQMIQDQWQFYHHLLKDQLR